jgi:hypothetical protein
MIEWYTIEYLYPNSFGEFTKMMFPNVGLPSISILQYYDIKKLYNFFDKYGVYLTIEMITKNNWVYTISITDNRFILSSRDSKQNRELIEIDGFYECFRILENKLNFVKN